jgi:hypothetical protein
VEAVEEQEDIVQTFLLATLDYQLQNKVTQLQLVGEELEILGEAAVEPALIQYFHQLLLLEVVQGELVVHQEAVQEDLAEVVHTQAVQADLEILHQ